MNDERINVTRSETVTLWTHLESKITALEKLVFARIEALGREIDTRLSAMSQALALASEILKERLTGMNEVREQLDRQARTLATCASVEVLDKRIESLTKSRDELEVKIAQQLATMGEFRSEISSLKTSRDEAEGKASQLSVIVALGLSIAGLLIGLVSLLTR